MTTGKTPKPLLSDTEILSSCASDPGIPATSVRDLNEEERSKLIARIAELEAGQQSQPADSTPSVLLPFSEEEIERTASDMIDDVYLDDQPAGGWTEDYVRELFVKALLYANTKAVSIDKIMEVVGEWIEASENSGTIITLPLLPEEWEPLRERLSKLNTTSP